MSVYAVLKINDGKMAAIFWAAKVIQSIVKIRCRLDLIRLICLIASSCACDLCSNIVFVCLFCYTAYII